MTTPRPDCSYFQQLLGALADDELGRSEKSSVEAHLAECSVCRRQQSAVGAMLGDLRGLPETVAGPNFLVDLRSRIDRGDARASAGLFASLDWFRVNAAVGTLTAACLCFLFVRQDTLRQAAGRSPGDPEQIVISDATPAAGPAAPADSPPLPATAPTEGQALKARYSVDRKAIAAAPGGNKNEAHPPAPASLGTDGRESGPAANSDKEFAQWREEAPKIEGAGKPSPAAARLARLAEVLRREADALAAQPPAPLPQAAFPAPERAKLAVMPAPAQDSGWRAARPAGGVLARPAAPDPAGELGGEFISEEKDSAPSGITLGLHASAPRAPFASGPGIAMLESGATLAIQTAAYDMAANGERESLAAADEAGDAAPATGPAEARGGAEAAADGRAVDPSVTGDGPAVSRELLLHYFGKRVVPGVENATRARQEGTVLIKVTRLRTFLRALKENADALSIADVLETSSTSFEFSAMATGGKEGLEALAEKLSRMPGAQPAGLMFEQIREKGAFAARVMVTLGVE